MDVFLASQVDRCMSIKVYCGGIEVRALIDTGCMVSVVYKGAYDRMNIREDQKEVGRGHIKGISNVLIPVEVQFRESVRIGGLGMEESEVFVIDSRNEKYDVLLGYKFLSANGIVIHPDRRMIEKKVNKDGTCQMYVNDLGKVDVKLVKGVEVFALEDRSLKTDKVVSVKVGWNTNVGVDENQNSMFLVDGYDARYRVKRVAHVFDGIIDLNNPRVCMQKVPDVKKKRVRGIRVGDVVGSLYSVFALENSRENECCVLADDIEKKKDWVYDGMVDKVKLPEGLNEVRRQKIARMLWERRKALSKGDEDFGGAQLPAFRIVLSEDTPIYQRPRHFPPPVANEIEEQCEELERIGVLEESESPWNSPIVPVRKPDGRLRLCIDYRKVNEKTVKDRFPMCVVSECVYSMYGMKVFTKMDLVRGYYQMPVEEDSRCVTAFSTAKRHYQFRNLSFGLANALAAFQRAMNVVLNDFPSKNVMVFIDDILVMNESF